MILDILRFTKTFEVINNKEANLYPLSLDLYNSGTNWILSILGFYK